MTAKAADKQSKVIARAEAALASGAVAPADLEDLLTAYRKIDKQMNRLTRISDRQQLQLKELNDLKNKFVGMAAHDLRNPIGLVQGFSDLMLATPDMDPAQRTEYLGIINSVAKNMAGLLNDLLDISAIESGRLVMEAEPRRLDVVVRARVDLLANIAQKKDIALKSDMAAVDGVMIDENRLAQVIDNLITNAVKFSYPETTITVSVWEEDGWGYFAVADQGQGIPADEVDKVFGTFQRLSVRPTGDEKSHGLGMAIVKKIVTAHGGRIDLESEVGKGSTFTVRLPKAE